MKQRSVLVFLFLFAVCSFSFPAGKKYFNKKFIRAEMLKVAQWQIETPKHHPTDWTNGAFYAGLFAAWETTRSADIYQALMEMGTSQQWKPAKRWYHADDIAICQTYIDLFRIEKRPEMLTATIDTVNKLLDLPYPVKGIQVIKWWWCDALFMGPPTLVKLGITLNEPRYLEYSDKYFKESYDLLYNREEKLFARDLNYVLKSNGEGRKESNGKRIFWSRGNGWVLAGLVKILKELPADYPQRAFYENLYREMAARIVELQQNDGFWRASLLDPDAYPGGETSGTGFFCYALAWGINHKLLDNSYLPAVEKAWIALSNCVGVSGRVGWVQPVGAAPSGNLDKNSWEVYGTGAYLLAGSEVIKLKR